MTLKRSTATLAVIAVLAALLPKDKPYAPYVKVIDVRAATGGRLLEVVMSSDEQLALGYLRGYEE